MPRLSAREVARICDGMVTGDPGAECGGFGADTRSLPADSAFVAIRSGHAHVPEAFAAGAPFALVERADCLPAGASAVVVGDVTAALGLLAAHVRSGLGARVVGITGSVGKTLTKDFIAAALSSGMKVHASPRNFNNDWGMPLTVLSCPDDAQALVVELGARGPGEIARLCRIVRPHVGVITGIGTSHIEFFGSREGIARSKSELLACLPAAGLAVVSASDDFLDVLAESTSARVATVGPGGHVGAERVDLDESGHAVAILRAGPGVKVQVRLPLPGRPLVRNAAMAVRVAMELGVGAEEAAAGIAGAKPTGWRMETTQFG
ncbi:MAG TPA: UDP-N-acetylmuramoyl-tripeptide--D-alanyl-D-alanine ligase, partial [Actinomycetota bacterium]|nr:UDP-N-acetylmuramoyl-tripeptide--D-alanyl-D-alanine ligase [Actinomycetota bacterium]